MRVVAESFDCGMDRFDLGLVVAELVMRTGVRCSGDCCMEDVVVIVVILEIYLCSNTV